VDYLLSAARFNANVHPQGAVDLTAELQVVLLDPRKPVQILLPIENAYLGGPGHCLVDGAPHPVLAKAGEPGFYLELRPKNLSSSAIAEKPGGRSSELPLEIRHVQLTLHGTATLFPTGGRYQFSIPPVPSSRFEASLPDVQASIKLRGMSRPILSAESSRTIAGVTGAVRKLDLLWTQQPSELPAVTNRKASVITSATVHPLWIEWQIRVKDQPVSGTSSALWSLPPNTVVKAVRSDRLDSFQAMGEQGLTRLLLKFQEPLAPDTVVDIHCTTPRDQSRSAPSGQVQLPALSLFPKSAVSAESMESEFLLGVNASPELAIGPVELPTDGAADISLMAPDTFLSAYRMSTSETLSIRPPQQAYRLSKPGELTLPVELRLPAKRVWLNQEGHIGEREIRWTLTAEIETAGAKAFRHVLKVPENFLIDAVSIQEDETERLVRWTKSGSRLELVLGDGTTAIQNVSLSGYVPLAARAGETVPLPLIQVENADVADSQLRVFRDRALDREVGVLHIEGLPALEENGASSRTGSSQVLAAVRLTSATESPAVLVGEPLEESRWDMALAIEPATASKARLTAILRLLDPNRVQETLQLRLPPEMAGEFRVESAALPGVIVPYETLPNSDGSLDLVFDAVSQESLQMLRIESSIELPADQAAELPTLRMLRGRLESLLLLASPSFAVHAVDQPQRPQPLALDELPSWFLESNLLEGAWQGFQLYRDPKSSWRIEPAPAKGRATASDIIVRTTVWLTDPDRISGQTQIDFPAQSLASLSWQWPGGTLLTGCLLDGKELSPVLDEDEGQLHLLIPSRSVITPMSAPRLLELHWSVPSSTPLPRFGQIELALPKPLSLPPHDAHLELVPASHVRLIPHAGLVPSDGKAPDEYPQVVGNSFPAELPHDSEDWAIELWTMDSRTESFLMMGLFVLIAGAVLHWAIRRDFSDWLHAHPGLACFFLGVLWWLAFAGSAWGFFLVAASPVVAWTVHRKTAPREG
jgi:hypothetical protein